MATNTTPAADTASGSMALIDAIDAIDRARLVAHTIRLAGKGIVGEDRMLANALIETVGQIDAHLDTAMEHIEALRIGRAA